MAFLCWLFADALLLRAEIKTLLKALGFFLLTLSSFANALDYSLSSDLSVLSIWTTSVAFYAIFLSLILDSHSKLQLSIILAILALPFLRNHELLAFQASLIFVSSLQLAYTTKHRDIIPFGIGFLLIAIAQFFLSLEKSFEGISIASAFLYLFAGGSLLLWFWSYIKIRFSRIRLNA